jgi:Putative bacterial sensory transduction regulator
MYAVLYFVIFVVGAVVGYELRPYTYDGISIDEAAKVFFEAGLPAKRKIATTDEPYLGSNIRGDDFEIYFYNCTGDKKDQNCTEMSLLAGYPVRNAVFEPFNYWNERSRVVKSFLNQEKTLAFLRLDIHTTEGLTIAQLEYYLDIWQVFMPKFSDYLHTGKW